MKKETKKFLSETYATAGLTLAQGLMIDVVITILIISLVIWGVYKTI